MTVTTLPTAGCVVTYRITNQWQGGFQAEVTVRNTCASAINGWTRQWVFRTGEAIACLWNATLVSVSGSTVMVRDSGWNAAIAPRGAVGFRFAYVTYSGLRNADNHAHVLLTTDGGAHWTDISGNLPLAPTQDVVVDPVNPNRVYVASDLGVFTANVAKAKGRHPTVRWFRLGRGLPRAPVNDIEYQASTGTLYAATYGRSIWSIPLVHHD